MRWDLLNWNWPMSPLSVISRSWLSIKGVFIFWIPRHRLCLFLIWKAVFIKDTKYRTRSGRIYSIGLFWHWLCKRTDFVNRFNGMPSFKIWFEGAIHRKDEDSLWIEGLAPVFQKGYVVYANFRNNKRVMSPEYNLICLDSLMKIERAYFPYDSYSIGKNGFNIPTPQSGVFLSL